LTLGNNPETFIHIHRETGNILSQKMPCIFKYVMPLEKLEVGTWGLFYEMRQVALQGKNGFLLGPPHPPTLDGGGECV
jgi:hypothetical protein